VSQRTRVGELISIQRRGGVAAVSSATGASVLVVVSLTGESAGVERVDAFAVLNSCPHQGAELLPGFVSSTDGRPWIECPLHTWRFDVATGNHLIRGEQSLDPRDCLQTFACEVDQDGIIWLVE
jgi:nitrite reductase/ring-hydroxylating ferredoxin subunit